MINYYFIFHLCSGTCWKHQRILARCIKRARNAALIPYDGFDMKPKNEYYEWPSEEKSNDKVNAQMREEMKDNAMKLGKKIG